jgi:hypothetical protein
MAAYGLCMIYAIRGSELVTNEYGKACIARDCARYTNILYRVTTDSDHAQPIADIVLDRRFEGW